MQRRSQRVARSVRDATPWGFPVFYLGWAYLFWIPVARSGESAWSFPNVALLFVGSLSPLLGGLYRSG